MRRRRWRALGAILARRVWTPSCCWRTRWCGWCSWLAPAGPRVRMRSRQIDHRLTTQRGPSAFSVLRHQFFVHAHGI
jgi:hypothetical protein